MRALTRFLVACVAPTPTDMDLVLRHPESRRAEDTSVHHWFIGFERGAITHFRSRTVERQSKRRHRAWFRDGSTNVVLRGDGTNIPPLNAAAAEQPLSARWQSTANLVSNARSTGLAHPMDATGRRVRSSP